MEILQRHSITRTSNTQNIQIDVKFEKIPTRALLPFLHPKRFNVYCKQGCPNYSQKWTCPPHCPEFGSYAHKQESTILILFCTPVDQFSPSEKEPASLQAYNFIKEELQAWLREMESTLNGKMIAANSCEICKKCTVEEGLPCHSPEKIRYNLVAFGFDVSGIMETFFDHKIQWAETNDEPEYVSSVGALLFEQPVPKELLSGLVE